MLRSMTGFGRAERLVDGYNIKVNLKSVNHRYVDITVRLPKYYGFAEDAVRQMAMKYISRGKVEVFISVEQTEGSTEKVVLDKGLAGEYIAALRKLSEFGVDVSADALVAALSGYKEIFRIDADDEDEEHITELISEVFAEAAEDFVNMRTDEGKRMESDIFSHIDILEKNLHEVEERYPGVVKDYRARLESRIREVLSEENVDETRLLTEAAIYAEKSDIGEETVRLASHIKEFRSAAKSDKPIGKKLDFIIQEMNRETNTMGSKSSDIDIAKHIVEMKSEIEKIREQVQNIE